MIAQIDYI